jgi:hypothetical protein
MAYSPVDAMVVLMAGAMAADSDAQKVDSSAHCSAAASVHCWVYIGVAAMVA